MNWVIPLVVLIVFELIADIFAEEWSLHNKPWLWVGAFVAYTLANIFWLYAMKSGVGLTRGAILFSVSSAVLATFVGFVLYKEVLTPLQITGVIVGLVSIVLICWE